MIAGVMKFLLLILFWQVVDSAIFRLQAENFRNQGQVITHIDASGKRATHLKPTTTFCDTKIPFSENRKSEFKHTLGPAKAIQKSYPTTCAEIDNVKVFLYHESVKKYRIRAKRPGYHTLANHKGPDFKTCHFSTDLLWEIKNISFRQQTYSSENASVKVNFLKRHSQGEVLTLRFALAGRESGLIDQDSGATLTLSFASMTSDISTSVMILGRSRKWENMGTKHLEHGGSGVTRWSIPDYSWVEKGENILKLVVNGDNVANTVMKSLKLKKRFLKADKSHTIIDNSNMVIEGVNVDMWWLRDGINITLEGNKRSWNVNYFRFYFHIPWTGDLSQTFVMYQDGNVRLLPFPPRGTNWIPFGSSVLIGQVNSSALRPAAEIVRAHINPDAKEFTLYYKDGGIATLTLTETKNETVVNVHIVNYGQNPAKFPFVSFRSMWVKDGNADVDHVSANGYTSHHILGPWRLLYGYTFIFYRSCISTHNTQSPDISIEILE